jgi:hypothetical protein
MLRVRGRIDSRLSQSLPRPAYHFLRSRYYDARTLVRRNPGRGRVLPDFVVIGAAKSGTTSLYDGLSDHPFVVPCVTRDAYFSNTKEIRFFDYDFYRGTDWYRWHFPLERERAQFTREHGRPFLTGEASPSYLSNYWAPRRLQEVLPRAKLIALLRNPVDRAYSQFQLSRRAGEEELESFEEATAQEEDRLRPELARMSADPRYNSWLFGGWSYLARSRYAEQLERWLELFPRGQFLFLKAEDLFAEPERTLQGVYDFLDLPSHRHDQLPRLNAAGYEPMPPDTRARLVEYFRPHNDNLYNLIGIDFGWERKAAPVAV